MSSPSDIPTSATGKVIINAQVVAAPGKADALQKHLSAIRQLCLLGKEPGCLEYRAVRSFVKDGSVKFAVFEVYANVAAVHAHFESEPFKALIAATEHEGLTVGAPQVEYFYEFE